MPLCPMEPTATDTTGGIARLGRASARSRQRPGPARGPAQGIIGKLEGGPPALHLSVDGSAGLKGMDDVPGP